MNSSWQLQILDDDGTLSMVLGLSAPSCTLGRDEVNGLVLDRESVSGTHCRFSCDPDGDWWVEDLGSTNGLWKGEEEITGLHRLIPGDVFEIGLVKVRVVVEEKEEPVLEVPEAPEPPEDVLPEPEPLPVSESVPAVDPPFKSRTATEKLQWALEKVLKAIARVHACLALWLPRLIGGAVRGFCRLPLPARFSVGFAWMALFAGLAGWWSLPGYFIRRDVTDEQLLALKAAGLVALHSRLILLLKLSAALSLGAAVYAWVKRGRTLLVFKAVLAFFYLIWMYVFHFYTRVPSWLNDRDYKDFPNYLRNEYWITEWTPWVLMLAVPVLLTLGVSLRVARNHYRKEEAEEPLPGDEVLVSLQTGGRDPRMRSSSYWSTFAFLFILAWPFLLSTCGWEEPYGLPKGSGEPVVEMVKVQKKKKKPKKKMVVNNWSPYIFERMEIDDIKVLEDLEAQSMDTYEIMQEKSGKLGKGGGKQGGWPEGMEGTVVRFIRLEYSGGDWDQGMEEGSDINLLTRFNQITGFPVARESEAKKAGRLKLFPKGRKPPFVYMTGKRGINFSSKELETLRWYTLEEGGLLFVDDGGPGFRRQVDTLVRRLYPGKRFVDIPNDDPIFRAPFVFPSGAPPLWQHGGSRAKGIRHDGRWVLFYHPGDLGDAWINSSNEVAPEIAEQAYRMGINVMYYAFNQYYARHFE